MKKICILVFCISLFMLILLYPQVALQGATQGLSLWSGAVLPALMPFSIAASLISACGVSTLFCSVFATFSKKVFGFGKDFLYVFLSACLSGYPMGAKLTADLYQQQKITGKEASAMLNATSTSGPMFLSSTVSFGMLGSYAYSKYLLLPHYISATIMALFAGVPFRKDASKKSTTPFHTFLYKNPLNNQSFGSVFSNIVGGVIQNLLLVGGYMVIYTVYIFLVNHFFKSILHVNSPIVLLLLGLLEMTTGCKIAASMPIKTALILINGFIGFGGFSIHSQTRAIAAQVDIKVTHFLIHKSIQGILAAVLCALQLYIFPLDAFVFKSDFLPRSIPIKTWGYVLSAFFCFIAVIYSLKTKKKN